MRGRYVVFFVRTHSDLCSGWVTVILYTKSFCIEPLYNGTRLYLFQYKIFVLQLCYHTVDWEDTFTTFEIQTWLPDFILRINPFRIFCAWSVWAEVTNYHGNNTVIFFFNYWQALIRTKNCLTQLGNTHQQHLSRLGIRPYSTHSYFTVVKVSSSWKMYMYIHIYIYIYIYIYVYGLLYFGTRGPSQ